MTLFKRWFWYQHVVLRYLTVAAVALILAQILVLAIGLEPQEDPIFLHYTTSFGVDFVGAWYLAYLLPLASLVVLTINGLLARALLPRNAFSSYLMISGAVTVALLLSIQAILLVYINA